MSQSYHSGTPNPANLAASTAPKRNPLRPWSGVGSGQALAQPCRCPQKPSSVELSVTYLRASSGQQLDHLLHELLLGVTTPSWRGTGRRRSRGNGVLRDCASSCGGRGHSRHAKGAEAAEKGRVCSEASWRFWASPARLVGFGQQGGSPPPQPVLRDSFVDLIGLICTPVMHATGHRQSQQRCSLKGTAKAAGDPRCQRAEGLRAAGRSV